MFAGAWWSFVSALCTVHWDHYETAQTLSMRATEGRLSWFTRGIENYCKTSQRLDARGLYNHAAMDLTYSLESHCIICASTEQQQYQDTCDRVLWHTCWVCPYWKICSLFSFAVGTGWSLLMKANSQPLLAASARAPPLTKGNMPSSPSSSAEHPITISESTISSAHKEVLRKVPFSYLWGYHVNGSREISLFIHRPDVNSRSDKPSELRHLEQKTGGDSVWDQTNIHKPGCGLM